MADANHIDAARELFISLCREQNLTHREVEAPVKLLIEVPRQNGLAFDVVFTYQNNDELWLRAAGFTMSYFPFGNAVKVDAIRNAASDLLSGRTDRPILPRSKTSVRSRIADV